MFGSVHVIHCNPDETVSPAAILGVSHWLEGLVTCAVTLPGWGSDERCIRSVFAAALAGIGVELVALAPRPGGDVVVELVAHAPPARR